jgi:hypothetical protein
MDFEIGDLVRLNSVGGRLANLLGIILTIEVQEGVLGGQMNCQVTWTDGDLTWEFGNHLEVVCK